MIGVLFSGRHPVGDSAADAEIPEPVDLLEPKTMVPEDWPNRIVLFHKSGRSTEHDAKVLYDKCYRHGWQEYILDYTGEFPVSLDLPISCQTGYERVAAWAGSEDCKTDLKELEMRYGRERLVGFLRTQVTAFEKQPDD